MTVWDVPESTKGLAWASLEEQVTNKVKLAHVDYLAFVFFLLEL